MLPALGLLLALSAPLAQAQYGPPAHARYEGRPVVEVLEEMRGRGLGLIYSTQLVPGKLRVLSEPRSRNPRELLGEVLRPHGLALSQVGENLFAVVAAPAAGESAPAERTALPLSPESPPLQEVVVSSSRYSMAGMDPAARAVFTRDQVEIMPRLGDEALRAVQRLPGAASNGFSGLARIRGGEENESEIVLNGLMLYEPFHLKNVLGPVSLLDSRLIDGVEAHTGGYAVEHGDRMSAIIDVRTLDPPLPAPDGGEGNYHELGFSVFHANALASGSFGSGKSGWLAAVRRSNLDLIAQLSESDYGRPRYFDAFGRITYGISPATQLAINLLGSHDGVTAITTRERSRLDYGNRYLWGELDHESGGGLNTRLVASLTYVDNDRRGSVEDPAGVAGTVRDERNFSVVGLRYEGWLGSDDGNARLRHRWGAETRILDASYHYAAEAQFSDDYLLPLVSLPSRMLDRRFDIDPSGESHAAWLSSRIAVTPRLTAELGLRWDAQSHTSAGLDRQVSPRLNLLYRPSDAASLRASWGRYFQSQGIHELQVEDGVPDFFPAQRADHLIVSLERQLPLDTALRIELYRKDYSRLRPRFENLFDPLALMPELRFDRVRIAPEAAHVRAAELLLSRRGAGPWSGWLSYTLSRVVDRIEGREVARSWDQRHALQMGLDRSGRLWDFALTASWHSGWPTTALFPDTVAGVGVIRPGARNSERLEDFSSLDLRVSRRIGIPRGELEVFGEVTNALDRANPCCTRYFTERLPDGSVVLEGRERHWLPLVPSIGLLWKF